MAFADLEQTPDELLLERACLPKHQQKKRLLAEAVCVETNRILKIGHEISVPALVSKSRERVLARPRMILASLLLTELKLSTPAVGSFLGGRDHTTIIHARDVIAARRLADPWLTTFIDRIKSRYAGQTGAEEAIDVEVEHARLFSDWTETIRRVKDARRPLRLL